MPDQENTTKQVYPSKVIYDFTADANLVPQIIGYRQKKGFTVIAVSEQPEAEANYITGFDADGFPVKTSLRVPPQAKAWLIVSKA
jgi:hypothetical protein